MQGSRDILRLLIVDDDDVDREAISRLIRRSGLQAEIIETDGARGLFASEQWTESDCILLDFHLADSDGLAILEHMRLRAGAEMPPVVMLTGAGSEWIAVETIKRGGHDYLVKDGITAPMLERSIRNAIEKRQLAWQIASKTREMERLSLYDALTGLPNRNLYLDRLTQMVKRSARTEERFALFVMDLDQFKEINDTLGHQAGDALLKTIGARLSSVSRESDTVARLGGDEFAAILPTTNSVEGAVVMAEKIEKTVRETVLLEQGTVQVGISIGIVFFPEHGRDTDTLFRNADIAMYEAKREHRGHLVYEAQSCSASSVAALVTSQLSRAIERGELVLDYQPKVELHSGAFAGLEALVRWHHPEFGVLLPDEFVPRAERMALITPMTFDILESALGQITKWRDAGFDSSVAVNLSARLLDEDGLAESIERCLRKYGLPGSALTLEITETGVMTNVERAVRLLSAIRARGVGISIDDFGSGYTSLKHLMDLPISELKVDRLFIEGVAERTMESAIVSSIVEIARGFDITVVAEGVETDYAWDRLSDLGCHHGQGFFIGRPMPPGQVEPWIADWHKTQSARREQLALTAT